MKQKILALAIVSALSACGSSNDDDSTDNTSASFSGDLNGALTSADTSTSGTLSVSDPDDGEDSALAQTDTATSYGTFTISVDGQWSYTLDATNADVLALVGTASSLSDAITVTSVDGTTTSISITISGVAGTNTPAVFSGDSTGSLSADGTTATGTLVVTDPDSGEDATEAQTAATTSFGSFTIDTDGQWTYTVDNTNATLIALGANDSVDDTVTVTSVDGTAITLTITINGVNEDPTFGTGSGVDSSAISNDLDTAVTGTLSITDLDTGEDVFVAQSSVATSYGTFSIATDGMWTYTLDTTNTTVLGLASESDSIVDEVTVSSADGSDATISITISGVSTATGGLTKGSIGDNDSVPTVNCTVTVSSTSELEDAVSYDMTPGETVCLASGTYGDFELSFGGAGTEALPITVAAAVPGDVIINGESSIGMTGSYVVFQGFVFKDGNMDSSLLQTRANSNTACNNCRITENTFVNMDAGQDNSTKWFQIYGSGNRFDHNWVSGKETRGALFIVERGDEPGTEDRTQIDHNYFADRPPFGGVAYADNSDNEYEGIRIGTSSTHTSDSFAVVEHNYFERIDGEAEVISVKAGGVTVAHNTIRNSRGSIVSRHGEGTTIDNNYIIGDGNPFAGGVRIVDANHSVTNNYIQGARNPSSGFYGGILISASDGSTSNGYQDVENVLVANNTVVDSVNSINLFAGNEDDNPEEVYFVNNVVADAIGPVFRNSDEMPINSVFAGNYIYGQSLADDESLVSVDGFTFADPMLSADSDGLYRPTENSADLSADLTADTGSFSLPTKDMDGQTRSDSTVSGADEILTEVLAATDMRGLLTPDLVGPLSYTAPVGAPYIAQVTISNDDFDSENFNGWTNTGAEITTETDEVFSRGSSVKFDSATDSISQTLTVAENTNYTLSAYISGPGKLSADVGGVMYSAESNSDSYNFTTVSFNSGTATSVDISASIDDSVLLSTDIENDNFDDDQDGWVVNEGTGIGQVQDSDNSASGNDGSIKFKYNDDDSGTPYDPYIAQTIAVEPNTDYTLTMYILLKSSDEQDATVLFGAHTGDAVVDGDFDSGDVIASKDSIYGNLSSEDEGDDDFRPDTLTFNSGANTSITIFAKYQSTLGDDIRIDDFSLTSQGSPADGEEVFVDSFRLVSHPSL
ncbi:chondroitinase-B domain-containing protein [uncultured Paraglaciecola sp.]|uniref:chondroitinase-B domain-containing protein n=1 Tax=uncultured Paraglaciecola sp. TaxID=1765024 RepID=UPI0025987386|nr:chondroitinase-B domain-containing protein [uncultured Paraglaciecola sp.]